MRQVTHNSTPASEGGDSIKQDAGSTAREASYYDNDNNAGNDDDDEVLIKQDAESTVEEALCFEIEHKESDQDNDEGSEASKEASDTLSTGHPCES